MEVTPHPLSPTAEAPTLPMLKCFYCCHRAKPQPAQPPRLGGRRTATAAVTRRPMAALHGASPSGAPVVVALLLRSRTNIPACRGAALH